MDELEEILYEYRLGLRELPDYNELLELNELISERIQHAYNQGFSDGKQGY